MIMNKKKLYNAIMESISKQIKKALNEHIEFNTTDIFNNEESFYDYNEKEALIYRKIENKIQNIQPISDEEFLYYFKMNNDLIDKLLDADKISNNYYIMDKIIKYNLTYKVSSKEKLREIICNYSKKNPTGSLNWIDTSQITDMSNLIRDTDYGGDISKWDVSNVTDMSFMFSCAYGFNQPIGDWDVRKVNNMQQMFNGARTFNQPIGDWDVSNVTNMAAMFCCTCNFNQPIGDWDVRKVNNMANMFWGAEKFNQDISNWKLKSKVKILDIFGKCPIKEENKPKTLKNYE